MSLRNTKTLLCQGKNIRAPTIHWQDVQEQFFEVSFGPCAARLVAYSLRLFVMNATPNKQNF
jgi:hypothetical protein